MATQAQLIAAQRLEDAATGPRTRLAPDAEVLAYIFSKDAKGRVSGIIMKVRYSMPPDVDGIQVLNTKNVEL